MTIGGLSDENDANAQSFLQESADALQTEVVMIRVILLMEIKLIVNEL